MELSHLVNFFRTAKENISGSGLFQKSLRKLVDGREDSGLSCYRAAYRKELAMFGKLKKNTLPLKTKLFNIRWYPSNRSCVNTNSRRVKLRQMPPLMVRKAEWRR